MAGFNEVIIGLKQGRRYRREWWSTDTFIFFVPGSVFRVNREPLLSILGEGTEVQYSGHVDMRYANNTIEPWHISQSDLTAEDWVEVSV